MTQRPADADLLEASMHLEERARVLRRGAVLIAGKAYDGCAGEAAIYRERAARLERVCEWLDAMRLEG
jgi:hypothetical protein